jgi:dipeptidyl aminopeptidase/acylaminoacyl peptidase
MRRIVYLLALTALAAIIVLPAAAGVERREEGNLVIEGIPEIPQRIIERMFQYQSTREASFQDWDHGGGMLISTRFGETEQIHHVASAGAARRQITFFDEPVRGASFCPDPRRNGFLFAKDVGGGEAYQVFWFDLDTGQYTLLTDGESRNGSALWSNRGERFVFYSTRRNGRDWDLHLATVEQPGESKPILEKGGFWIPVDWSPDDKKILAISYVSANESTCHVIDVASGETVQINPSEETIAYGGARWSRDGKGIYITSDQGGEFSRLKYYDLESQTFTVLTPDLDWDIGVMDLSEKGDLLAFTANEDGIGRAYLLDTATRAYRPVPGVPLGQVGGLLFHPDGKRLALSLETARSTTDVYTFELAEQKMLRWTCSEVGGLRTDGFVDPQLVHFDTFDTVDGKPRQISAFYYQPPGEGPHPVAINFHGGPEAQYLPGFSPLVQYFVNELGVAVLAPNVRGSAGYGKSFLLLDNGFQREDSVKDAGALLDWIAARPELDAGRVAVFGGSYGGYMALAAMTHYNDRLKAGIDVVGISNFVTFLENTKDYRRDLRRVEYGDERDAAMREHLQKISPLTQVKKITKPLLVVQGLNDPRVPVGEAEQIVAAIRGNGGKAWYLMAKDEGHGFSKKSNRDFYYWSMVLFIEENLLK